jgi:hypothetical protein
MGISTWMLQFQTLGGVGGCVGDLGLGEGYPLSRPTPIQPPCWNTHTHKKSTKGYRMWFWGHYVWWIAGMSVVFYNFCVLILLRVSGSLLITHSVNSCLLISIFSQVSFTLFRHWWSLFWNDISSPVFNDSRASQAAKGSADLCS